MEGIHGNTDTGRADMDDSSPVDISTVAEVRHFCCPDPKMQGCQHHFLLLPSIACPLAIWAVQHEEGWDYRLPWETYHLMTICREEAVGSKQAGNTQLDTAREEEVGIVRRRSSLLPLAIRPSETRRQEGMDSKDSRDRDTAVVLAVLV